MLNNPTAADKLRLLKKEDTDHRKAGRTSITPVGVLNKLTREEIPDLLAYVISRGDEADEAKPLHLCLGFRFQAFEFLLRCLASTFSHQPSEESKDDSHRRILRVND